MVPFLIPYLLLPLSIRAGPVSTASLPPSLTGVIPSCAQSCLKSSITQNFPTCQYQQDLNCLCINNAASGLTLGEQALACLASTCAFDVFNTESIPVYEVCQGVANSKPMTHSVLTATQSSTSSGSPNSKVQSSSLNDSSLASSTLTSTSIQPSSTFSTSAEIAATARTFISSSSTSVPSDSLSPIIPRPTTSTSTSTSTQSPASSTHSPASPTPSSPTPTASPVLTNSQIAGVTIGCAGAAAISFGLLFFLFCRRRRQRNSKRRNSGSSFGGDKIIESQPVSPRTSAVMPRTPEHVDRSRNLPIYRSPQTRAAPATNDESRWTTWPRSLDAEEMGVAVNPGLEVVDGSPHRSTASRRTNSQLLPDKPTYSLYPSPLRIKTQMSPISPIAGTTNLGQRANPPTRSSHRGRNSSNTSQVQLQRGRFNERFSPQDPFVDPQTGPPPPTHAQKQGLVSPSRLPYPNALNYGPWTRSAETTRKPVPARQSLSAPRPQPLLNRSEPGLESGISTGSLRSRGVPSSDLLPSSNPQPQRSIPRRKSNRRRPSTYFSMNSDTSFEDAGDVEEMPRQYHSLFSVAERPYPGQVRHPRISGSVAPIRNLQPSLGSPSRPQRPRVQLELNPSLDKSLPRAPAPLDHPASLLAKRRGNERATELAQELRNRETGEDEQRQTAKWKILVSPGLEGIKDAGTPTTFGSPRTKKSVEWASPTSRTRRRGS